MESKNIGGFLKILGLVLAGLSVLGGIIIAAAYSDYGGGMSLVGLIMGLISGGIMMIITGIGCIVCDVAEIKEQNKRDYNIKGTNTNSSAANSIGASLPRI